MVMKPSDIFDLYEKYEDKLVGGTTIFHFHEFAVEIRRRTIEDYKDMIQQYNDGFITENDLIDWENKDGIYD